MQFREVHVQHVHSLHMFVGPRCHYKHALLIHPSAEPEGLYNIASLYIFSGFSVKSMYEQ